MSRMIMTVFVTWLAAVPAMADFRILNVSGVVRVAAPGGDVFAAAVAGQPIAEGTKVQTGENGRVLIEVGPRNTIRLRSNASIVVGATKPEGSRIKLLAGRIKGVFAGLTGGRKFDVEFESRSAVASVKGTTLDAEDGPDGIRVRTVFGAVDLFLDGTRHGIPQGCGLFLVAGKGPAVRALSSEELDEINAEGGLLESNDRSILHSFVDTAQDSVWQEQDVVTQIREDDFAVGRSLRDVHGNLTRVDQRLVRPFPNVIQVVNLVKRDEYQYHGVFGYTGSNGPRFDYFEGWVQFNRGLPADVLDWPAFFSANEDIDVEYTRMTLANGRVGDPARDVLETEAVNDHNDATEDARTYLKRGTAARVRILRDELVESVEADGMEVGQLFATSIVRYGTDLDNNGLLDLAEKTGANQIDFRMEAYVINEEGGIISLDDITNGALRDPIGLLRTSAIETIISGVDGTGASMFTRGNIDLVVIPDLVLAIATKYGPSLSDINSGDE